MNINVNNKKICFIICTNDEVLLKECMLYINQLEVPVGYVTEVVPVKNAASMTSGYNMGMKNSDAKYKVYLHQDVLIVEKDFISKILDIFNSDEAIGMLGMVGNRTIAADGCPWSDGMHRRVGEIYADLIERNCYSLFSKAEKPYEEVVVVDGLLMATQYDLPWREDLFQGWDFYDCSQSLEFIKAGYQVVVPYMEKPWCYHDNDILNMVHYEKWRRIFHKEYENIFFKWTDEGRRQQEREAVANMKKVVYQIFTNGSSLLNFPYPPICKEENTDYICFTDLKDVFSHYWKIEYIENLNVDSGVSEENEHIKNILSDYDKIYEIKPNQIIVEKIFETESEYPPIITVPSLDKLPNVKCDLSKLVPTKDQNGEYIYKKNPVYKGGKYEGREYVLTIGVPVSNQIGTIERCLAGIKPLLDHLDAELVVVDTGSTDGTIDVCKKYGARIVEFPWCDNMSAARNTGIYHAKGLWYLSIDDDEWFENVDGIIEFFKKGIYKKCDAAGYIQKNRLYKTADVFTENFAIRAAKITPELHFEGRIHDCLTIEGSPVVLPLHAVANHEGFIRDDEKKLKKKYRRNTGILLYDVYEYPEHLRYNYQLANEMATVGHFNESLGYFFRGIAIDMEYPDAYFGRQHATSVLSTFYHATSERLFPMTKLLLGKYKFTDVEMAYFYYNLADVGLRCGHKPEEILENYKKYLEFKNKYDKNPLGNEMRAFTGTHVCKNEAAITDGHVMAFCAYSKLGNMEDAAYELNYINPEEIFNETLFFIEGALRADNEIFESAFDKISPWKCEMWINEFAYEFSKLFSEENMYEVCRKRMKRYLQRLSIKNTDVFEEKLWERLNLEISEKLRKSILCDNTTEKDLQGLYFETAILRKCLSDKSDMDVHMDLFFKYVQKAGSFAEKYYSKCVLNDDSDMAVSGEIRAAYDIYTAMKYMDDKVSAWTIGQMIERLRHALKSFPGFKTEISYILDTLTQGV